VRAAATQGGAGYVVPTPSPLAQYPGVSVKGFAHAGVFWPGHEGRDFLANLRIEPKAVGRV